VVARPRQSLKRGARIEAVFLNWIGWVNLLETEDHEMIDDYDHTSDTGLQLPTQYLIRSDRLLKMLGIQRTLNAWMLVNYLIRLKDLPHAQQDLVVGQINGLIEQAWESE
jgi:hypothetical protein